MIKLKYQLKKKKRALNIKKIAWKRTKNKHPQFKKKITL